MGTLSEMDNIVPPNENSLVYRNFSPPDCDIYQFLDFVDIKNDRMLIGSSNFTGRIWDGIVCYYDKCSEEQFDVQRMKAPNHTTSGASDAKFLADNIIIVGHDSGQLKAIMVRETENKLKLTDCDYNEEHEDVISEISVWDNSGTFVTCGHDLAIKCWESPADKGLHSIHTYSDAHFDIISSVSAHPSDTKLFASCSFDKTALLWDIRTQEQGKLIYESELSCLTNIEWHKTNSNQVVVGTTAGDVYLLDVREPTEFVAKNSYHNRSVHRISCNQSGLFAVCADDCRLIILDCANDEMKVVYENSDHMDMVRGLAWQQDKLISCGWDQKVLFHNN